VRHTVGTMAVWAEWNQEVADAPWTVGVEEEVMLLSPSTWLPVSRCEDVLAALPDAIADRARAETHGSALELATNPHTLVSGAAAELAGLRSMLAGTLEDLGVRAAVAGTHPGARWEHTEVSPGARYQYVHASMRELARREPTFGLHVHVAVPGPEQAVRALNAIRSHLPLLLALSGNSPFWQGRDSGLASARTPVFQAFPRTGPPRRFADYADYVEAIDVLVRNHAIPEPTFLWWDARLQPAFGTLEVRIMDAQTRAGDVAALVALVQCLVRLYAEGHSPPPAVTPETLDENRFLAARDGMSADFVDVEALAKRPARERLAEVVSECMHLANALGCTGELEAAAVLAAHPGDLRQRDTAARLGLRALVPELAAQFVGERSRRAGRPRLLTISDTTVTR
jgi:glutamate---cysteine ligase / carboxylate-amine ligase